MNYLKVEAIIEIDENMFPLKDKEDIKFFIDAMKNKEETSLQIWNDDMGDQICVTNEFKWTLLTEIKP